MLLQFCQWLSATALSISIAESNWVFSIIETVHVLGTALMAGTIAVVDLRLLGIILKQESASRVVNAVIPWTWTGLIIMFVSGALLFISEAEKSYGNWAFRLKLLLLLAAGLNALGFHRTVFRDVSKWDDAPVTPLSARLAGITSLFLWTAVIASGRAIAYLH